MNETWEEILGKEFEKEYYLKLKKFILDEYASKTIYPSKENVFNAFNFCPFENLKVVIIGQDPYHTPGYAHGLCFSVNRGIDIPMSLQNIYKELKSDIGMQIPNHGCLESWAEQGVLLLNSVLTVEQGKAGSHAGKGWETFTNIIVKTISDLKEGIVFLLWGKYAQEKGLLINQNRKHKELNERIHRCVECGYEVDRDLNAAINILRLGTQSLKPSALC
jgi:uracil-DNA glycosylase